MSIIFSPNEEIGRSGDSALGIFLRSCLYEPEIGLSRLRQAVRSFLNSGNSSDSFDVLQAALSRSARGQAEAEIAEGTARGLQLQLFCSPDYPAELLELAEPPASVWTWGKLPDAYRVAIVGSRACSAEGACFARTLSANLTRERVSVVSGLARGIDSAAHQGAVQVCRNAPEPGIDCGIAVLGSGLLRLYPPENRRLAESIVECGGGVISEYRLNQAPHPFLFPDRNRIISALAKSVVVVEAGAKSGSLITARLAEGLGRQIFTVPGSVRAANAKGCNELIRLGGRVLLSPGEVDEILPLGWHFQGKSSREVAKAGGLLPKLDEVFPEPREREPAMKILSILSAAERNLDELCDESGMEPGKLLPILTKLELKEIVLRGNAGGWALSVSQE